jgi:hypothetical protein
LPRTGEGRRTMRRFPRGPLLGPASIPVHSCGRDPQREPTARPYQCRPPAIATSLPVGVKRQPGTGGLGHGDATMELMNGGYAMQVATLRVVVGRLGLGVVAALMVLAIMSVLTPVCG